MKKFILSALALSLSLAFIACSDDDDEHKIGIGLCCTDLGKTTCSSGNLLTCRSGGAGHCDVWAGAACDTGTFCQEYLGKSGCFALCSASDAETVANCKKIGNEYYMVE